MKKNQKNYSFDYETNEPNQYVLTKEELEFPTKTKRKLYRRKKRQILKNVSATD